MGIHIGAILGPALFGQLVTFYSYGFAWRVMAAFAAMAAVLVVVGRRLLREQLPFDP
jgi:MFS family permease